MTWNPIHTIPRDGSWCCVLFFDFSGVEAIRWEPGDDRWEPGWYNMDGTLFSSDAIPSLLSEPTPHAGWVPLPDVPALALWRNKVRGARPATPTPVAND